MTGFDTCFLEAGATKGNVGIALHFGVRVGKVSYSERAPLIRHRLHKGQGLGGGRANVVHPALLEAAEGRALVGGHQPSVASVGGSHKSSRSRQRSAPHHVIGDASRKGALLEKRQLQCDLYERVWTHLLLFDELLPISFKSEHVHVEIIHQPVATKEGKTHIEGLSLSTYMFRFASPVQSVSRC